MVARVPSALACAAALGGCSFTGVERASAHEPPSPPCTSSYERVYLDVAAVALGGVLVVAASDCHNEEACLPGAAIEGFGGVALGLVSLTSAIYGVYEVSECRDVIARGQPPVPLEPPAAIPKLVEAIAARDPVARRLTLRAHEAAARHECAGVDVLGARVRELDPDYYTLVFSIDPPIAACLAR